MKLTFKDLKQQKFVIEAEPTETILQIKERIAQEKGWEVPQQKLIYSGKILQDEKTVESYNIEEKGFIVCMFTKPKAAPASTMPQTPAQASSSTPAPPAAPASGTSAAPANPPATPSPAPTGGSTSAESATFNDPSALALGSQREAAVANMESMGFPRAEIDRAMRAAFFNPDRAVEYLLNGIPENVQHEQQQQQAPTGATAQPSTQATGTTTTNPSGDADNQPINLFEAAAQAGRGSGGSGGARSGSGGGSGGSGGTGSGSSGSGGASAAAAAAAGGAAGGLGNLDFLRNNPQFQQLRQVVQQQPHMLEPILQQVGAGNPQLAQLIGQNRDQFLQLLSEDVDDDAPLPPGAQAISVTEDEREAIERLCRLGFERDLVIQAYFACDKNEELAANFLFDQPDDTEDA